MAGMQTKVGERKAKRREKRAKKIQGSRTASQNNVEQKEVEDPVSKNVSGKKRKTAPAKSNSTPKHARKTGNPYDHLDHNVASALLADDREIEELEAKLGLANKKEKSRLGKEYSKLEGYGDDFGDFLDDLDGIIGRVMGEEEDNDEEDYTEKLLKMKQQEREEDYSDEEDEQFLPMKEPAYDELDEDDSVMEEIERQEGNIEEEEEDDGEEEGQDDERSESGSETSDHDEADHDIGDTYTPLSGEDIYGKKITSESDGVTPKKYVPPHLRKQGIAENSGNDEHRAESLRMIQRLLNSSLNRLSEDTLISVAQSISQLYQSHPKSDVNECIWSNTKSACVSPTIAMVGLIPTYVAALAGAHIIKGDSAQLGEHLMEMTVVELWDELKNVRETDGDPEANEVMTRKETTNLTLIICYLYNYGVLHCSLLYDIIRNFIESFKEIDVELLLIVLSHCGRALRSDDPTALKEIVLLVQQQATKSSKDQAVSSRVDYMLSAMNDLKNNKRRKQDQALAERTAKLRKLLGQIKTNTAAANGGFRTLDSSLRISLKDILEADAKGRWWKVGASWVGNQYRYQDGNREDASHGGSSPHKTNDEQDYDEKLLKLAAKYRMNTDTRRSIFCIIMGSTDCDECFEKLVRAGMLKSRTERETVRVLMECCGNEKSFNKYYAHLASRIHEYQPKSRFTFQLAFWDLFKQFEDMKVRKAANLAKLLFHLVVSSRVLKLHVLKVIDMSSIEELPEAAMIFITIFLTSILEHFDDPADVKALFEVAIPNNKSMSEKDVFAHDSEEVDETDEGEALRANLTVFFLEVLKSSPKYKKGSKFRDNLKVAVKVCDTEHFF